MRRKLRADDGIRPVIILDFSNYFSASLDDDTIDTAGD